MRIYIIKNSNYNSFTYNLNFTRSLLLAIAYLQLETTHTIFVFVLRSLYMLVLLWYVFIN